MGAPGPGAQAKRELSQRERQRERCMRSIFWTAWYICGFTALSQVLHYMMATWLQKKLAEGYQRILVLVPRTYFKTSVLGVAGVVHHLLNNPEHVVLYVMHRVDSAVEKMSEVKQAFESDAMRRLFPDMWVGPAWKSENKWGAKSFTVPRKSGLGTPSVTCEGITSGSTGGHYDLIIWDDPIKGDAEEAAAQIAAARKKLKSITFLWRKRIGEDASLFWVIGTLHEGGFYETVMARKAFAKMILGVFVDDRFMEIAQELDLPIPPSPDYVKNHVLEVNQATAWQIDTPILPERETMASLAQALEDAEDEFQPQLLNLPKGSDLKRFQRENFFPVVVRWKHKNGALRPINLEIDDVSYPYRSVSRVITWDPTGGIGKSPDHGGIVVAGWLPAAGIPMALDLWEKRRTDVLEQVDVLLEMAYKWDVQYIVPELAAFQIVAKTLIENKMRSMLAKGQIKHKIPIRPYKRGSKSKATWIFDALGYHARRTGIGVPADPETGEISMQGMKLVNQAVNLIISNGQIVNDSPALLDCLAMSRLYWKRIMRTPVEDDDGIPFEEELVEKRHRVPAYGLQSRPAALGISA